MIEFAHPEAFLLLPLWGMAVWLCPGARLLKPLRVVIVLLLLLAWANPFVDRSTPGMDVWVMADGSLSARDSVRPRLGEIESVLTETKGADDRLFFVDFAEEAILRDPLSAAVLSGRTDSTRIGSALQYTLSLMRPHRNSRLLLLSDGYATDSLDSAGERLLRERVPLDIRLMRPEAVADVRVDAIDAPLRVRQGDPFLLEARLSGPSGTAATVTLVRDGQEMDEQEVRFRRGEARAQWTVRLSRAGAARFDVRVEADEDAYAANNRQTHWVEAAGSPRVLVLSAYRDDPIAGLLRESGMEVELVTDTRGLTEGSLSGVNMVWIHNVHAADVPVAFLDALPFYVREQGGGLIMVGGKASFGSGGYFESAVDELLPVSMELKEEDRKLSVAVGIVMDRSGSMSAGTAGGMSKMQLANQGAARAIELLGEMDSVTVFAVDTEPHQILPLSQAGRDRERLTSIVRRIQSGGGGIYVFNGLEAVWKELQNAPQPRRHIILFSDAADSEQPNGVDGLLREMLANQTTVSVIALGNEFDADAPFLEQIATDGQGRIFYNEDADSLPGVFAQETVSITRSAFLEDPVGITSTPAWREVAAVPLDWPGQVDGYNLSYLREGASESLRTADQYEAPILAHWQRGAGKVGAITAPLGGPFSEALRFWEQTGDLVRSLNRWAMRGELPPGLSLRMERIGDTLRVRLYANEDWRERFALHPPRLITQSSEDEEPLRHEWRRILPGELQLDLPLGSDERLRGAIQIGSRVLPFGPVNGMAGAEWVFDPEPVRHLQMLSAQSGGQERVDLAGIWQSPPRPRLQGTRNGWLIACALLFLFEALWSRLGGKLPEFESRKRHPSVKEDPEPPETTKPEPAEPEELKPRSAFRKARHPRRG
ncbi:MAG: VWA domain-containing protein [Kiritimatiellia bacterium]